MEITNEKVRENVKSYLHAVGKSEQWVSKKMNISEVTFKKLLNGEANLYELISKLNHLFRIRDPLYFYNVHFNPPKNLDELEAQSTLYKEIKLKYPDETYVDTVEFKNTMDILESIINMTHILKTAKELG